MYRFNEEVEMSKLMLDYAGVEYISYDELMKEEKAKKLEKSITTKS